MDRLAGKPVGLIEAILASDAEIRAVIPLPRGLRGYIAERLSRDPGVALRLLEHDRFILLTRSAWGLASDGGIYSIVNEVAATTALLVRQCGEGIPAVVIRGLEYEASWRGAGRRYPRLGAGGYTCSSRDARL